MSVSSRRTASRPARRAAQRRPASRFRRLAVDVLEERCVLTHLGDLAVLSQFTPDPALAGIASQPPGETTGPTPTGFASYSTLANGMPILNSLPSSPTAIYLDFDGDTSGSNPYGDHTVSPYSEDADGTTFNLAEQRSIYEAWREVSAYFAMFDTNVTTVPPPAATPKAWLAVGNNISGGYSYVGVFPNTTPESWNQSGDARTRVSGLTHELGHNFGLQHQATYDQWGVKTAEYASATDPLHGALMGVDYSGVVHKFILGHNSTSSGVTTLQDDLAIIANKIKTYQPAGGDGFRADDFGNTLATAAALPVAGAAQWTSGIIERLNDVDAFTFTVGGGTVGISAAPDAPSGVDLKLEVYAGDGSLLAASDGANNVQQLALDLAPGTYYALVSSHLNYGDVGRYFLAVSPLPAGWKSGEVGVGVSGYSVFDEATGVFNPVGTGAGLTGSSDGFQFAYQTLNGDGSITARVTNVDNTSANALAGITIRESTAVNARHVSVARTSGGVARLLSRSTTGGGTTTTNASGAAASDAWVRVVRSGSTFTAYTSADGAAWTLLGSVTVSMTSTVTVGLLTASANQHALNVGQLDNVSLTGSLGTTPPTYNALAAPTGLSVSLGTGSGLSLAWDAVAGAAGYAIDRSADGVNFTQIGTTAGTAYSDPGLAGSQRWFYRVSATDASGRSAPSAAAHAVNRPGAVSGLGLVSPNMTQLVLNWRETTGETGYTIRRSSDGGATYSTIATVGANVPSYTDSGLTAGQTYTYLVTPTSSLGDGVASAAVSGAPRLAAVTPTLGTVAAGSISLQWTDIAGETGYRVERSVNGTTFSTLVTLGANVTSYADTTVASAGEYYYRVFGVTAVTQSLTGGIKFAAAPSTSPPPAPWSSADVGTASGPGTTDLTAGTFKLVSSGNDVAGTSDAFRFTSQALSGDGEIVARVASLENTGTNAKAGVMIRQSTAANAANAFVYVTPTTIGFSYRGSAGGGTTTVATLAGAAPQWVKLVRSGNAFTASYSSDGAVWTQLGTSVTIAMSGAATVGLAAAANSTTLLNTSNLTNVNVTALSGPSLAITDVSQAEGNSGTTDYVFTVSLSAASAQTVTVNYATADGTALAGTDYAAAAGTLTFAPGVTSQTITVAVTGDSDSEPNETFFVNLTNAAGATVSDGQGQGLIQDDEPPVISINDVSVNEGNKGTKTVSFTVTLSKAAPPGGVSVTYATANGSAVAPSDYVSASGVLTLAAGQTSGLISVTIVGDRTKEPDETFFVNLSAPTNGAVLGDAQGAATIRNDDKSGGAAAAAASGTNAPAGGTAAAPTRGSPTPSLAGEDLLLGGTSTPTASSSGGGAGGHSAYAAAVASALGTNPDEPYWLEGAIVDLLAAGDRKSKAPGRSAPRGA